MTVERKQLLTRGRIPDFHGPVLTAGGKVVIIALMFTGRIAPLVLAVHLAKPAAVVLVRQPREELALG